MSRLSSHLMSELTVIIPTWNQCQLLEHCLHSLGKQTVSCHILVVDNGSIDSTQTVIEAHQTIFPGMLECLQLGRNFGFARAVNEGIKAAQTDFIALLNNDTEADPHWVEAGLHALKELQGYSFFASKIVHFDQRDLLDCAGDCYSQAGIPYKRGYGEPVEKFSKTEPVLGASAAAAFYLRSLFDEIGLFDEDFIIYLEDVDLSLRAQLLGHRCLYLPDAIVYHIEAASDPDRKPQTTAHKPQTPDRRPQTYYSQGRVHWITRNRWQLMLTYQPVRHLPWIVYGWMRSALFHLFKAGFFVSFLLGLLAGLLSTPRALRKRFALHRKRVLSVQQFCQLLGKC
ncbi:MAG: glycosyltransferase family 2 protein [Acidobacteria bacterium]|nr:glycosyltransferase family 2 protein [Acidobacteriota bacterium]